MFAGRSTSFSTLSSSTSLKSKSSPPTTKVNRVKKSMSSSSFSVVTTTIIALLFFIVIDIEYVACMSLDRLSIEKNELPTEKSVKKDDIYIDDDRELEAVPEFGNTELFVLVPGGSANERESVDKNTIETKERDEDAPSAIESEGDMLMMESNGAPATTVVMQQTVAAPESIDEDEVKVESVEYKEDETKEEMLKQNEKQQIAQLIAQAQKEDDFNLPPLALPLVGMDPKEVEKEVGHSLALTEDDDDQMPMIAQINATNEMGSEESSVPIKFESPEMESSAPGDSAMVDSDQEIEDASDTETLSDAIADVIEDAVEDNIESALSNDEDLSTLTDAVIDEFTEKESVNKVEQENVDKILEEEKQEAIESLTAIEDMLSEESAPIESVVQKDESVENQKETAEKSEEDTNKSETEKNEIEKVNEETQEVKGETEEVKNETETIKHESETVKDETETSKDEIETPKDELEVVKVETEAIKDETEAIKDEAEVIKDEVVTVKDEIEAIKDEAIKDETVEIEDETAEIKNENTVVNVETVEIKDENEPIEDETQTVPKDEIVSEEINETLEEINEKTESNEKVPTESKEEIKEEQPIKQTNNETKPEENKLESEESVAQDQINIENHETTVQNENENSKEKLENLLQSDDFGGQHNQNIKEEQQTMQTEEVPKVEEQQVEQANKEKPEEILMAQQHEEHRDETQILEEEKKEEIPPPIPTLEEKETQEQQQQIEEQKIEEMPAAPAAVQHNEQLPLPIETINSESMENKKEQELPAKVPTIVAETPVMPDIITEIKPQHSNEIAEPIKQMDERPTVEIIAPTNVEQVTVIEEAQKVEPNESTSSILTTIIPVVPQVESQLQSNAELPKPSQQVENEKPTVVAAVVAPQVAPIESISSSSTQKPLNAIDSILSYVNASSSQVMLQIIKPQKKKPPQLLPLDEEIFNSQLRRYDGAQVWRIVVQNDRDKLMADQLQTKYDGQLWKEVKQEVDYLLKPQVLAEAAQYIRSANLSRIVLIDNLQNDIESENPTADEIAQLQNRKGHRLTWQAYHRLADIHGYFDYLAKTYPDICSVETIGYSLQKRPLKVLKISNGAAGNPSFWLDGGMHAREWISPATVTYIANQLVEGWDDLPAYMKGINWYIHAVANPDGYEYSHTTDRLWRKNMRSHGRQCPGVDLNRNFGYKWGGKGTSASPCAQTYRGSKAFSEPETFYISKFISNFPRDTFQAYMSFHSYGQYILYPWGYDYHLTTDKSDLDRVARQAGTTITKSSGVKYTVGSSATTLYPAAGGSDDWAKGFAGIKYTYTIEMGDTGRYGFILPASFIETNGKDGYTFVETVARAVKLGKENRKRKV